MTTTTVNRTNQTTVQVKRRNDKIDGNQPHKRRRSLEPEMTSLPRLYVPDDKVTSPSVKNIIEAVERLSTEPRLVADGSRDSTLPTVVGKHKDLTAISAATLSDVLNGVFSSHIDHVTIIDCRYPYEYEGGHIEGAVNLYTRQAIREFLSNTATSPNKNHVIIFHCEFSSERGPKMYRHLRSLDREVNADSYPKLNFPEMYLLEGGYKEFFQTQKKHCSPQGYTPMLHKNHSEDLRHFRVKSKSWAAGDQPRHRSRVSASGTKLCF
ncbi:M-phase inducer phosphatase-like [Dreissena polymorpha]|uniref:M-phase inducer phosphatase-like n=1 Tax=Dreissena polymorpha TaxID=45954 RepID=UPI0022644A08|nr:M-phase inducer phosphatase-like [Dreissena polymorpha]